MNRTMTLKTIYLLYLSCKHNTHLRGRDIVGNLATYDRKIIFHNNIHSCSTAIVEAKRYTSVITFNRNNAWLLFSYLLLAINDYEVYKR